MAACRGGAAVYPVPILTICLCEGSRAQGSQVPLPRELQSKSAGMTGPGNRAPLRLSTEPMSRQSFEQELSVFSWSEKPLSEASWMNRQPVS
jgi:hypothetical protein